MKDYPPYLDYPKERKPETNYDRLVSKTPEELAKFIASQRTDCYHCPVMECVDACEVSWLDWLKAPVEEGE